MKNFLPSFAVLCLFASCAGTNTATSPEGTVLTAPGPRTLPVNNPNISSIGADVAVPNAPLSSSNIGSNTVRANGTGTAAVPLNNTTAVNSGGSPVSQVVTGGSRFDAGAAINSTAMASSTAAALSSRPSLGGNGSLDNSSAGSTPTEQKGYTGMYEGSVACAGCDAQYTILYLNEDNTYMLRTKSFGGTESFQTRTGSYSWDNGSRSIRLEGQTDRYQLGDGQLMLLGTDGQEISNNQPGANRLNRSAGQPQERHWKLVELDGEAINLPAGKGVAPYIVFQSGNAQMTGFGGCNSLTGNFNMSSGNRIQFSKISSGQMPCMSDAGLTEEKMIRALQNSGLYRVENEVLTLHNSGDGSVTARFVALYE